jgi:hypothetical protein
METANLELMSAPAARGLLERLSLDTAEIAVLARQGFVREERDKMGNRIYKLRFRVGQRQRVKFIGRDRHSAQQIEAALVAWQRHRRLTLSVERLRREVSQRVREQWRQLDPILLAAGYRRHGREIRMSRKATN